MDPEGESVRPDAPPAAVPGGRSRRRPRASAVILAVGAALGLSAWAGIVWLQFSGPGEPRADGQIEVFTFVETGIVYLDPDTSEIIWQNTEQVKRTIGERPWRNSAPTDAGVAAGQPWNLHRDIVGNPEHNVVSWVETVDGRRGDILVVEADTGEELARAPIEGPQQVVVDGVEYPRDDYVVIASVDDEAVYFAVVDSNWPWPDVHPDTIGVWRWAAGEDPRFGTLGDGYFNDLSAGVSAFYSAQGTVFEHADGERVVGPNTAETDFGAALSPDGRFWYPAKSSKIVETATGEAFEITTSPEQAYGWTGAAELVLVTCDGRTGECQTHTCDFERDDGRFCTPSPPWPRHTDGGPFGVCAEYGLACRSSMPTS